MWGGGSRKKVPFSSNIPRFEVTYCYGLNCVSPRIYAEVLTPRPPNCDLIWKQGLDKNNQVKRRSVGWALSNLTGVLTKRGNLYRDRHIPRQDAGKAALR